MNAAERIKAALTGEIPDRLPVMETIIDWKVMKGLGYSHYYDLIDGLDMDAIFVNQLAIDPNNIDWLNVEERTFIDAWGSTLKLTEETWPITVGYPITSMDDLKKFEPPNPEDDPILRFIPDVVKRYKGEKAIGLLARAVFVSSWNLYGMTNLLMAYHAEPELVKELARIVVEYNKEFHRLAIEAGVDIIILGDDYAFRSATIMSPQHFREFILPGFKEVVQNVKACGGLCIKHSDGNLWGIMDDLVATGIHGTGPLEPGADMDLAEVKRRYPNLTVMGNVDVDLLSRGTEEDVRAATLDLIKRVSPGGRHILSSGNSISSSVKPENLKTMVETAREYGTYRYVTG